MYIWYYSWFYGVMVSTLDFESSDPAIHFPLNYNNEIVVFSVSKNYVISI